MLILGIDTTGLVAACALAEGNILRAQFTVANGLTHSETLLPMIDEMFSISGLDIDSVDAIAVSSGPGSFTGLRIGAATAKGLALALDIPVIKVSSLQAMGLYLSRISDNAVCPIMNARRHEVYGASYRYGKTMVPEGAYSLGEYFALLSGESFLFIGDGVDVYADEITERFSKKAVFAGPELSRQQAASVASLGHEIYENWLSKNDLSAHEVKKEGAFSGWPFDEFVMTGDDFSPIYLRKPQAEREREAGRLREAGERSLEKIARQHRQNL